MTTFFNKKEDVLDLELTEYGKYLLSLGRFNPDSYAFFDDEILYDSKYGGFFEGRTKKGTSCMAKMMMDNIAWFFSPIY